MSISLDKDDSYCLLNASKKIYLLDCYKINGDYAQMHESRARMLSPGPEGDFMTKKRNKKNRAPLSVTAEPLRPAMSPDLPPPESYPGRSSQRRFLSGNEHFLRFLVKN
jgi:hypothetical protein